MRLFRILNIITAAVAFQIVITAATFKLEKLGSPIPSLYPRYGIAYGEGVFVMAAGNTILYSTNAGTSWVDAKVATPSVEVFVKYVNGYFFVGGGSAQALNISDDGIHWRAVTLASGGTDIAFGAGKFVVVGRALRAYSSDTITWTAVTAPPVIDGYAPGVMVAYGNGIFIAAEQDYSIGYHGIPPIDISTDGIVWTRATVPVIKIDPNCAVSNCASIETFQGLAFLSGKFVAYGTHYFSGSVKGYRVESTNGADWTVTSTTEPVPISSSYNTFSIVNGQITNTSIAFDGSVYLATSLTRGSDLSSLVPVPTPVLKQGVSAAQNGSTIVQVGASILYSTNNWETLAEPVIPDQTGALKSIRFADSRFVAVGSGGTVVRAFDGINWSRRLSNTTADLSDVAYGNGFWVAVGANGKIIVSADNATSFAIRNSGTELPLYGVTFGGGAFVAVGANGIVLTSRDTYAWTANVTDDGKHLLAVTYGDNRFVATGTNGIVNVSIDSLSWTSTNIAGANVLSRVAYGNGSFFTTEFGDRQGYFSANGLAWTKVDVTPFSNGLPPAPWINGVDFTGGRFLLSGEQSLLVEASPGLTVSASLANGFLNLNLQAITNGSHTIFSTSDIGGANWQNRGSINVTGQATWSNSVQSATMQFFRVRQD